jgi:hypothetical protein
MNARALKDSKGQRAPTTHSLRRGSRCRRCPLCTASGQCRDSALKSGRCGDWVWYMIGSKQFRRLWLRPRDPRTPSQRYWRARFGSASKAYSASLTAEQQDACIAAGAKMCSRPRLGDSGCLTGQQWWIRRDYKAHAAEGPPGPESARKCPPIQEISAPSSDTRRSIAGIKPGPRRRDTGRTSQKDGGKKQGECRSQEERLGSEVMQPQRLTRHSPVFGRASVPASPYLLRHQASQGSRGRSPSRRRYRSRRPNNKTCTIPVIQSEAALLRRLQRLDRSAGSDKAAVSRRHWKRIKPRRARG